MLGYLQRAGPGKATPRQSLAARQPGNSWPLRLYPDVMRRYSPLPCCAMVLGKYKNTNMQTQISNKCNGQYFHLFCPFAFFHIRQFAFGPRWSLHFDRCINTCVWYSSNLSCRSLVTSWRGTQSFEESQKISSTKITHVMQPVLESYNFS